MRALWTIFRERKQYQLSHPSPVHSISSKVMHLRNVFYTKSMSAERNTNMRMQNPSTYYASPYLFGESLICPILYTDADTHGLGFTSDSAILPKICLNVVKCLLSVEVKILSSPPEPCWRNKH